MENNNKILIDIYRYRQIKAYYQETAIADPHADMTLFQLNLMFEHVTQQIQIQNANGRRNDAPTKDQQVPSS